ncbi:hypothetical protein Bbelb_251570 [Branchiostoma belcheri]|nr:hypothetical protein Bbelb_251570 [Branchiostoma belcheri]
MVLDKAWFWIKHGSGYSTVLDEVRFWIQCSSGYSTVLDKARSGYSPVLDTAQFWIQLGSGYSTVLEPSQPEESGNQARLTGPLVSMQSAHLWAGMKAAVMKMELGLKRGGSARLWFMRDNLLHQSTRTPGDGLIKRCSGTVLNTVVHACISRTVPGTEAPFLVREDYPES